MGDGAHAPDSEHAVDALIRLTAEQPKGISIVCIGPLTNIALATIKDPDFVANAGPLYIMGGSNNARGNITAAGEFNFYVDPEAARVVFEAGFDITVIPWAPLTLDRAVFSGSELREIDKIDTTLSRFFLSVCAPTLAFDRSVGIDGTTHPDSLTTYLCIHPEVARRDGRYRVDIETSSDLTRGYSAMSWGAHGLNPNATVVEDVDHDAFFSSIRALLTMTPTPSLEIHGLA